MSGIIYDWIGGWVFKFSLVIYYFFCLINLLCEEWLVWIDILL